jgi:hypothetical protein
MCALVGDHGDPATAGEIAAAPRPQAEDACVSKILATFQGVLQSPASAAKYLANKWAADKPLFKKAWSFSCVLCDTCLMLHRMCLF